MAALSAVTFTLMPNMISGIHISIISCSHPLYISSLSSSCSGILRQSRLLWLTIPGQVTTRFVACYVSYVAMMLTWLLVLPSIFKWIITLDPWHELLVPHSAVAVLYTCFIPKSEPFTRNSVLTWKKYALLSSDL